MANVKPKGVWKVKGGPKVYDFRGTPLVRPNGGTIRLLLYTHHIPVIHDRKGIEDLYSLGRVLTDQGLAINNADDAEGNIFLFTKMNQLCYGQRGANSFSTGTEHMHYSIDEPWPEAQLRAAAYLMAHAKMDHGVPYQTAILTPGSGIVGVRRRGQTTHEEVSAKAGFHDRRDPGSRFERRLPHVVELARFYERHGRF